MPPASGLLSPISRFTPKVESFKRYTAVNQSRCHRPIHWQRTIRASAGTSTSAFSPLPILHQNLLAQQLYSAPQQHLLLDFPNPLAIFHYQTPSFFTSLSYLLSHPLITLGLAAVLYVVVPRLWKIFVRFVVVPVCILGAGYVVIKNPQSFSTAGSYLANFTSDHPYATSAAILIALTLFLSPYLLTALLVAVLTFGVPQLPGPIRNFLPAPLVEIQQQLVNFSDATRGPVNAVKQQALRIAADLQSAGGRLLSSESNKVKQLPAEQERL